MEDKIVEIARFYVLEKAELLLSLLQSEGIECYLRNEYTTQVMGSINVGGIRVELLESDVPRAMEIMEANGYQLPAEDEEPEQIQAVSSWARHIPFLRNSSLENQIIIMFLIIAVLLALFIYLGSLLSS